MGVTLLQRKRKQARAVLLRILQIGAAVGLAVGVLAFAARSAVPAIFTQDVNVSDQVQRVLPMIALFMVSMGMQGIPSSSYVFSFVCIEDFDLSVATLCLGLR